MSYEKAAPISAVTAPSDVVWMCRLSIISFAGLPFASCICSRTPRFPAEHIWRAVSLTDVSQLCGYSVVNSRYSFAIGVLWFVSRIPDLFFIALSKPASVNPSPKASAGIHVPSKSTALYKSCPDCFFTRILTPSDCSNYAKSAKVDTFGSILAMRSRINSCSAALSSKRSTRPVYVNLSVSASDVSLIARPAPSGR